MDSSVGAVDHDFRQSRLSRFGRMLAGLSLGYFGRNAAVSIWLGRLSFNRGSIPHLVAGSAFATLWVLLRTPRSRRFALDW
jgi:hypothetical protein